VSKSHYPENEKLHSEFYPFKTNKLSRQKLKIATAYQLPLVKN